MHSKFTLIIRITLGIILLIFGLNKFLTFIPVPELPADAASFIRSLERTRYILPFIGMVEITIGLLLLAKKWVALSLVVLMPISINILFFHLFLNMTGILAAIIVLSLNIILLYKYWDLYRPLIDDKY